FLHFHVPSLSLIFFFFFYSSRAPHFLPSFPTRRSSDLWLVHQIDTVHWFTGLPRPRSVVANGGCYCWRDGRKNWDTMTAVFDYRSEEHTSELQSRFDLVCRLLLEKKKKKTSRSMKSTTK